MREFVERGLTEPNVRPDWTDLTRDFEVLDAVRRSLARRRTIDLHFETTSERSLFKTQMTAIGCGVLLLTLFAFVGVLFLGSVLDTRGPVELRAEKADTIFHADEFASGQSHLTPSGQKHWDRIEDQKHDPAIPILVEETDDSKLSAKRRDDLIAKLKREGIPNAKQRVEVYALEGPWLAAVMKIARIVVVLAVVRVFGAASPAVHHPARPIPPEKRKKSVTLFLPRPILVGRISGRRENHRWSHLETSADFDLLPQPATIPNVASIRASSIWGRPSLSCSLKEHRDVFVLRWFTAVL